MFIFLLCLGGLICIVRRPKFWNFAYIILTLLSIVGVFKEKMWSSHNIWTLWKVFFAYKFLYNLQTFVIYHIPMYIGVTYKFCVLTLCNFLMCLSLALLTTWEYSSVPNRRACTFIDFEKKIPPAWSYFGLHVY